MDFRYNDHWVASFRVEKLGRYQYTVRGWTDPFLTWKRDLKKRQEAGQDLTIDLQIGSQILGAEIEDFDAAMAAELPPPAEDKTINYEKVLQVVVEPVRARFSSWYELFPRSFGGFKGVIDVLPYVEKLGFNVLYLPPVHPIGTTARKGKNNAVAAQARRCRQPVGDRREGGRAQGVESGAGHASRTSTHLVEGSERQGHRDRARHRLPVLARPSVRQEPPGVVPLAARRHGAVRRESAEEVPGHLPVRVRKRGVEERCGKS